MKIISRMNDVNNIKVELQNLLKERAEHFPFMANFWKIEAYEQGETTPPLEFGRFNARLNISISFYKPLSRIIDFSKLEGE